MSNLDEDKMISLFMHNCGKVWQSVFVCGEMLLYPWLFDSKMMEKNIFRTETFWRVLMLTVVYGDVKNSIYNTSVYFKNSYEPEWFDSELAKEIVRDVDHSDVLSGECIQSPVLGQIPPERLSGGVKTLLLMLNEPDKIFNASTCGDNCAKWILEIGKRQDITINLRHMMDFGMDTRFDIVKKNGGEVVHSMKELIPVASQYLNAMRQE